jgi:NAD(P)-dependent dehydrogenase (short-subunit alcohol dehydrogenase family)
MIPRGIDIIVNNAGVVSNALIEHTKPQEFEWMYRANVLGPLLLIQATSPLFASRSNHKDSEPVIHPIHGGFR